MELHRPTLDRFTLGSAGRELVLYFSEGVPALSTLNPSVLSLSLVYTDSEDPGLLPTVLSASLLCSSVELGRRQGSSRSASRREILLRLDEPCAAADAANSSSSATTSAGTAENLTDETSLQDGIDAATMAEAVVGGFPSDWSKLVAEGVLLEDGDGGSTLRRETEGMSLVLNVTSDFVTDLSSLANPLVAVGDLEESFPGTCGLKGGQDYTTCALGRFKQVNLGPVYAYLLECVMPQQYCSQRRASSAFSVRFRLFPSFVPLKPSGGR